MKRCITLLLFLVVMAPAFAQPWKTENLIVVTLDGMRWQEVSGSLEIQMFFKPKVVYLAVDETGDFARLLGMNFTANHPVAEPISSLYSK